MSWFADQDQLEPAADLFLRVPRTSSSAPDQAIFVDQTTGASLPSNVVLLKIDRFGWRLQQRGCVQGAVRPVPIVGRTGFSARTG